MSWMRGDSAPPYKRGRFEGGSNFNSMSSNEIQMELNSRKNMPPSKVVAAQILNAHHPITMDTIHKVFSRFGNICRVVVFNRLSLNVFVEYADISSAEKAVADLHGMEIYQDSCTIKIEFSKKQAVQVSRNCELEWDFTKQPWNDKSVQSGEQYQQPRKSMSAYEESRNEEGKQNWRFFENSNTNQAVLSHQKRHVLNIDPPCHLLNRQKALSPEQVERALFWSKDENEPSKILLYTIVNSIFPITTQVIYKISSPFGPISKIVIFERFSIQAMVEFENLDDASLAKSKLHNCDIYPGCCTIRVEYAKKESIGVSQNDHLTWSRELDESGVGDFFDEPKRPAYDEALRRPVFEEMNRRPDFEERGSFKEPSPMLGHMFGRSPMDEAPQMFHQTQMDPYNRGMSYGQEDSWAGRGLVSMVYNLNPKKFNCERLFNLLCPYGIVNRIFFLKQKNFKTAIVEWADPDCVDRVIDCLSNTPLFGEKIQFAPSKKQNVVAGPNDPFLEDGTSAFKDFSRSRQNRFNSWSKYDNIFPPCRTLHFFNTPHMEDEDFQDLFRKAKAPVPTLIMWFPKRDGKPGDLRTGCLQFENITDAVEAMVLTNHATLGKSGKEGKEGKVFLAFTKERQDRDFN